MNPLAVVAIPVLMLRRQIRSPRLVNMRGKPAMRFLSGATSWLAIAAAVVHFGVVRNLPWYPFDLLAPGAAEHYVTAPPQDDPDPAVQP